MLSSPISSGKSDCFLPRAMSMLRLLRLLPGGPDQAAAGILAALMLADAAALAGRWPCWRCW